MMTTQRPAVLVTGGAGYIGSHAVLALLDRGFPVAVIDNLTTGFRFAVPEQVPFYQGDIENPALLARIFAEQGTRAVMHFAGSIVVPESVENPLKYYHNNTAKSRALIDAAVNAGVPHFIFSSTAATYGIPEVSPVTEDLPQSWYDTPNIHFCTIRDFVALCDELGATVESATALDSAGYRIGLKMPWWFWNFFGQQAVFLLKR